MEVGAFQEFRMEDEPNAERQFWNGVLNAYFEVYQSLDEGLYEDLEEMADMDEQEALGKLAARAGDAGIDCDDLFAAHSLLYEE